ncbi:retrovirus-related pol polyprotein from transposon TNT 1-94 [Tanacetum coccineum]|uniref:Retrovirus-related pol polyprotein from transposon TNT 1-94 n=1 Tax=Tanacetum coccineum TaxID=301880 RepID=A0ABQ5AAH1_9ASTR
MTSKSNNSELIMVLNSGITSLSTSVMKNGFLKTFPLLTHLNKMVMLKGKKRTLIEAARTMLSGSVFSKQYWTGAVATAFYTQNRSTIVKRHLKTPYEIFRKRIPNINFLHGFGCPVYIHNHKDHLEKFDEKADDVDDINIAETERYPPDEYLHPYEPSQRKNRVRPRICAFCADFDNVQWRNERWSCDLTVYQKACAEYEAQYNHDFTLEPC